MTVEQVCPRRAENPGPWEYGDTDEWASHAAGPSCSYCGSLEPGHVLELLAEGWTVGPTDKSYKIYLNGPVGETAKVYFQHFSEGQKFAFISMLNSKKIQFGYPGYFYVLPFFIGEQPS